MKKRLIALLLTVGLLTAAAAIPASAAELDSASAPTVAAGAAIDESVGEVTESSLPSSYSSLELGYTESVRDQTYNNCWAYSAISVMEVLLNKLGVGTGELSTAVMNYGASNTSGGKGWQRGYSDSGYPYTAMGYLTSVGVFTASDFPDSTPYSSYAELISGIKPYAYAESVIFLSGGDIEAVKTAVMEYGAAVGNFHFNAAMLNEETDAYFCDTPGLPTSSLNGHAIAVVGWDDAFSRLNFASDHLPANDGAWLCKNSWGEGWGHMGGYFWISYEDKYLFDSRFGPSYAISGASLSSPRVRMQQDEIYGMTYEFDYLTDFDASIRSVTYANVLDFSDEYNIIDKVIFESAAVGADCAIFYIPVDEDGQPDTDESAWTLLYEGTIPYQGYICADIDDFTAPLAKGAVGVRISNDEPGTPISIGVDEWLSVSNRMIFIPDSADGMSYLIEGGYALDVMDYYRASQDDIGGTFIIKALSYTGRTQGDTDRDGGLSVTDATYIQRYLVGLNDFSEVDMAVADMDGDGVVTVFDATRIQRMLVGLDG